MAQMAADERLRLKNPTEPRSAAASISCMTVLAKSLRAPSMSPSSIPALQLPHRPRRQSSSVTTRGD